MKKIVVAISAVSLCLVLAGCGRDGKDGKDGLNGKDGVAGKDGIAGKDGKDGLPGKDGKDGKDGVAGKDGLTFRVVTNFETAKCEPGETLASAICIPPNGGNSPATTPGFQTPNNAGEPNVMMATCPKMDVRLICTK
jgi:hypothetical protein